MAILGKEDKIPLIEEKLKKAIAGKELWGDINLSLDEYVWLKDSLCELTVARGIGYVSDKYPITLTTFMIFMARYKYNTNFWGLMSEELKVSITGPIEAEIGETTRMCFKKYNFDISEVKNDAHKNIAPILYEAAIPPESSLDDLFYILNYDRHNIFDPQLLIEDMLSSKSYMLRKPMKNFLTRFNGDRAIDFVLEVHDAMLSVDRNVPGESQYVSNYTGWKEKEKQKESVNKRKKTEYQARPYLSFDVGQKGLCLVLPRFVLTDEWIEEAIWEITTDDGTKITKVMRVFGDEYRRFLNQLIVSVPPAESYTIKLKDNEQTDKENLASFDINGIRHNGIVVFNSNGRLINLSHNQNYLQYPFSIIILAGTAQITEKNDVNVSLRYYPTNREGYEIYAIEPNGSDARMKCITAMGEITFIPRPRIDLQFEGSTLFGMTLDKDNLFVRIPKIVISIDEGAETKGLELRIGKTILALDKVFDSGRAVIDLSKKAKEEIVSYGTYSVRLYQDDHFLKQAEFSFLPEIKTTYSPVLQWSEAITNTKKRVYKFANIPDWALVFDDCVVRIDKDNYTVECKNGVGELHGMLKSVVNDNIYGVEFTLPIAPFELSLLDINGEIVDQVSNKAARINLTDLDENEYWLGMQCFGEYQNYSYSLILKNVDGEIQTEKCNLSFGGANNISLARFYDSLKSCPLPAQIILKCIDIDKELSVVTVVDNVSLIRKPTYSTKSGYLAISVNDDGLDLKIRKFGPDSEEVTLPYSETKISKNGKNRGYKVPFQPEPGIYIVTALKEQNDIFAFEDEEVLLDNTSNIVCVPAEEKAETISSFGQWLEDLITAISTGNVAKMKEAQSFNMLDKLKDLSVETVDEHINYILLAMAFITKTKISQEMRTCIFECMSVISRDILTPDMRMGILKAIVEMKCSQEIYDVCADKYDLLLAGLSKTTDTAYIDNIELYSTELSLLLRMGIYDSIRNTVWREKYRELIGRDAIRNMLKVPNEQDQAVIVEQQKMFLREQKGCKVKVTLSNSISGAEGPLQQMIEYDFKKGARFVVSKKPDFGIYFGGIKYVDQYVNWYILNHDKQSNMDEKKSNLMRDIVKNNIDEMITLLDRLSRDTRLGNITKLYDNSLRNRYTNDLRANLNVNSLHRYFYCQGIAAFFASLPKESPNPVYKKAIAFGDKFMHEAFSIAPKISKRDLLMAGTFIYLAEKEAKLCR